jgi:WhiB family redox-sensing transcriptional regulator
VIDVYALPVLAAPQPWMDEAACRGVDAELFYPERGESTRLAKAVCARCDVRLDCLGYALDNGEKFGIWGGRSERERRRIRRQLRLADQESAA